MAATSELYKRAGVVHGTPCQVCAITNTKGGGVKQSRLNILLLALTAIAIYCLMFEMAYIIGGFER